MSSLNGLSGLFSKRRGSVADKAGRSAGRFVAPAATLEASVETGRFVLPVTMRRAGRALIRMGERMPRMPLGTGHACAIVIISGFWFSGAVVGGSAPSFVSGTAATLGLQATDIVITGQVETQEQDIFAALGVGQSLVGFSAEEARQRLIVLPWVRDAAVRKVYPGKLTVALAEKRAMAVWQHDEKMTVVEKSGAQIARFGIADLLNDRFSHLPHLVGEGAAESASEILPLAAQHPQIAGRVKAYIRLGQRRWDLEMANGIRIKLPEVGAEKALSILAGLEQEERLLEREIDAVDMRIADRIVLQLQQAAAKTRTELVSARLKAMKKADRKL